MTDARQALQSSPPPDVLLVDLGLPDGSGVTLIHEVRQRYPAIECMVVTLFADDAHLLASIEAGATGYLLKDANAAQVSARIHELLAGGAPMSPSIARRILGRWRPLPPDDVGSGAVVASPPGGPLTPREVEVLQLVAKGLSFDEVGAVLGLSPHTVVAHVKNLYRKLAVHSRGEAVFEARQLGLIP